MDELRLVLAGAPFDTGNRGVEALGRSIVDAVDRRSSADEARTRLTILDNGWGVRSDSSRRYRNTALEFAGVRLSRRWHRRESWAQIRVAQALSPRLNPVASRFARADAVLDISGGDSFTDLYGPSRLDAVSAPKDAALRARRPLVLLPQTYGPFDTKAGIDRATRLVRASALAYARDSLSYSRLLELAGDQADVTRCRDGVDVAFSLAPREPVLDSRLEALLNARSEVVAGVNLSGLLVGEAGRRFGLAGDYLATMTSITSRLVDAGAVVIFVPHASGAGGGDYSDLDVVPKVLERLAPPQQERTLVLPPELDAAEMKWCMAQFDWMIGSRMHSTIGSLSQQVPTFGYAYSDKTAGVFDSCGVGGSVADARVIAGAEAVELMFASFVRRAEIAQTLAVTMPVIVTKARTQLQKLLDAIEGWRRDGHVPSIA